VLQAMSVERPVVAIRCGESVEQSQAAEFVGAEYAVGGPEPAAYIERVSKLIREPQYRAKIGKMMRSRVEQHFGFNQTARQLEQLCEQLLQRWSEASAQQAPVAQAA
jgi:glycosyltransferase involved in cell wall biosynthesis